MKRRTPVRGLHVQKHKRSSALILVLFFVVLLTAVTVAFLSRSMLARQVSNSSVGETKATLLANTAGDIIIGDLRQEIIDGSTVTNVVYPNLGTNVYLPKAAASGGGKSTATPAISGFTPVYSATTGLETDGLNNLVKRSSYNAWFYSSATNSNYSQNGPARASKTSSATASLNGRVITPSRWNSHYLLALSDPTQPTNTAPSASFVAPDWVLVSRNGVSQTYGTYAATVADPSLSNPNYVVGRYAYAIYDEGGLLDMNVAGKPSGLTAAQISQKGSLALADLTVLPISATNAASAITQTQIDNFIGWRNYASAKLSSSNGTYNSFTFDATTASAWLTNFAGSTNGYLKINTPTGATTPPTDQALLSRQQLISLAQSLNFNLNALQYMGTFSRSLEQPSFTPDPNRPKVINSGAGVNAVPPVADGPNGKNVDNYLGNNDAVGADDIINPFLLSIRVTTPFTRLDGTTAIVGEPLIKTKYPLSRLGLILSSSTASKSSSDAIYARFGIYRASPSSPWVYDHGITSSGAGGGVIIGTLAKVAAAGREPDFAELLKAAISVGSLGKGGPGLHSNQGNYQYTVDTSTDLHVLQIMANLIDQYDSDSYPTWIQMMSGAAGSAVARNIYGVEDIPYFYRYHLFSVVTVPPATVLPKLPSITFPANAYTTNSSTAFYRTVTGSTPYATTLADGSVGSATWSVTCKSTNTITHIRLGTVTPSDAGQAAYLYIPDIWNPHDPNCLATSSNSRPSKFRVIAETQDPLGQTPWKIGVQNYNNSIYTEFMPSTISSGTISLRPISTPAAFTAANTAMTFTDNKGQLFREPTLLWNSNPTGIALTSVGSATEAATGKTYYGIVAGKAPISTQVTWTSSPTNSTDGTYIVQGESATSIWTHDVAAYQQITFSLQYQDASGNWITYDAKYPDLHGLSDPNLIVNTADYSNNSWKSPFSNGQFNGHASCMDPRTARWGVGTASQIGSGADRGGDYLLENTAHTWFNTNSTTSYQKIGDSNPTVLETQKPRADLCNYINYSTPGMSSDPGKNKQMRWFSGTGYSASGGTGDEDSPFFYDGLLSQNLPSITLKAKNTTILANLYVEDADGMARPAMGAYAFPIQSTDTALTADSSQSSLATASVNRTGLPLATASDYSTSDNAMGKATTQSQSRPIVLNRPFRSVSEMSYTFRGIPWKNIDFFTPGSADTGLLDVFCVKETPVNASALVAGKVNLNTRQPAVLQAVIAGAYRDEVANAATTAPSTFTLLPANSTLAPLSTTEASNVASALVKITTDANSWRGPLHDIGSVVGHFVANPGTPSAGLVGNDWYTYAPPVLSSVVTPTLPANFTYSGLSTILGSGIYNGNTLPAGVQTNAPYMIQRFREAAIRPLVDVGQVRVWNLLIDVVSQTGRYPKTATGLDQFVVEGEKRIWLHVAIDRYTGQVIDKQIEVVAQ